MCLTLVWELLTSDLVEKLYNHLECNDLLPEDLKKSKVTKCRLIIEEMINYKSWRRIDRTEYYKIVYDMVGNN